MKEPVLIIMAAGMGSRYGGMKQIDKMVESGEMIMDFSLYDAMMAGFRKVIFVIKKEHEEMFRELIDDRAGRYLETEFAYQMLEDIPEGYVIPEGREKPWGTAHAVMAARNAVDGPFTVINADDYYGPEAFQVIFDYLTRDRSGEENDNKYDFCMAAYRLKNTVTENGSVSRGICSIDRNGYLEKIVERTKIESGERGIRFTEDGGETWEELDGMTPVSMNFWGFERGFMDELEKSFSDFLEKNVPSDPMKSEYMLPVVAGRLIDEGRAKVKVLMSGDSWIGVTYKADKEDAGRRFQSMKDKGLYPEIMWK